MPSLRPFSRSIAGLLAGACLLAGCQAPAPLPYTQQFDEHTGATVTTVAAPIVYYADAPDLAVNARDYVSVWAFEVKENAVRRLYLACELWSTIDRTRVPGIAPLPLPKQVNLRVDGIAVPLRVAGDDLPKIGLGRWPFPQAQHRDGHAVYLRVSRDQLRALANADTATALALVTADGQTLDFALWRDGRAAVAQMLADLP